MRRLPGYRKRLLGLVALLMVAACVVVFGGFRLNVTESLPLGIYKTTPGAPVRGSIVLVCLPREAAKFARERGYLGPGFCPSRVRGLGKIVLATTADVVTHRAEGIQVNQRPVANSSTLAQDSRARLLPHYPWGEHVLGDHQIWLYSPYRRNSYDSRYFGPLHSSHVISVLRPIWTWRHGV